MKKGPTESSHNLHSNIMRKIRSFADPRKICLYFCYLIIMIIGLHYIRQGSSKQKFIQKMKKFRS